MLHAEKWESLVHDITHVMSEIQSMVLSDTRSAREPCPAYTYLHGDAFLTTKGVWARDKTII